MPKKIRLTEPLLTAMENALCAALAGGGFEDGDFAGEDPEHFERARKWISQERARRRETKNLN